MCVCACACVCVCVCVCVFYENVIRSNPDVVCVQGKSAAEGAREIERAEIHDGAHMGRLVAKGYAYIANTPKPEWTRDIRNEYHRLYNHYMKEKAASQSGPSGHAGNTSSVEPPPPFSLPQAHAGSNSVSFCGVLSLAPLLLNIKSDSRVPAIPSLMPGRKHDSYGYALYACMCICMHGWMWMHTCIRMCT